MRIMMIIAVLISLLLGINNAYARVDEDSRNIVIAEQKHRLGGEHDWISDYIFLHDNMNTIKKGGLR